jgi:hypothetical protein
MSSTITADRPAFSDQLLGLNRLADEVPGSVAA